MVCCIFLSQFPPYRQPISLILQKTLVFFWIGVFLITFLYCILMELYFVSFFMYPLVKKKKKNQTYSDSVAGQKVSHLSCLFRAVFTSLYHLQLINSLQRKLQTKDTNRQASLFLHPCSSTLAVLAFKLPW